MVVEIGSLNFITYEKEVAWGDGCVGDGTCLYAPTFGLKAKVDRWRPRLYLGTGKGKVRIKRREIVEGTVEVLLYDGWAQDFLDAALSRTSNANGFQLDTSLAFQHVDLHEVHHYYGCMVDKMTIGASEDDPEVKISLDMRGEKEATGVIFSRPALPTGGPYAFHQGTATLMSTDVSALCRSWEITVENKLLNKPFNSSYQVRGFNSGGRTVSLAVSLDKNPAAIDLVQKLRDGTAGSFVVAIANNTLTATKTLTITVKDFVLDELPDDMNAEEIIQQNVSITGEADSSDDDITAVIA